MYTVNIYIIDEESDNEEWIFSKYGLRKLGHDVYYDIIKEELFQIEDGKKISALSNYAFGVKPSDAIVNYMDYLEKGKRIWDKFLTKGKCDTYWVDYDYEE